MEIEIIKTNENCCCRCEGHGEECEKGAWIYCDLRRDNDEKFEADCGENLGCNHFSEKINKICPICEVSFLDKKGNCELCTNELCSPVKF